MPVLSKHRAGKVNVSLLSPLGPPGTLTLVIEDVSNLACRLVLRRLTNYQVEVSPSGKRAASQALLEKFWCAAHARLMDMLFW